jgi:integrase
MSLYKPKNSPHWYISIYHNGHRIRRPTDTSIKAEAKRVHDKWVADLWQQKQLAIHTGYTWSAAVQEWFLAQDRDNEDRYRLKWITAYLGDPPLTSITQATLTQLLQAKRATGANASTLARNAAMIRAILNCAKRAGWLAAVPNMPRFQIDPGRVRWLSQEEWQRLEPLLPSHLRQLARFTLATGLRRHNATHLRWDQVDMARRVAWVHAEHVKQRQAIGIPLNGDAMAVLAAQTGLHPEWVFPYRGQPVTQTATRVWREALAKAGIKEFTWHDLRHTWASWHVMNGTRLEELQKLGGWKTLEMVLRYAHLAPEHLARVADNVRPVSMTRL